SADAPASKQKSKRLNCTTKASHTRSTCVPWLANAIGGSAVRFVFTARRIAGNARGCLDIPLEISSKSSGDWWRVRGKDYGPEQRRANLTHSHGLARQLAGHARGADCGVRSPWSSPAAA